MPKALLHRSLRMANESDHVSAGRPIKIDHDVGVDVGDLRVAKSIALQAALIDEATCSDTFNLLEDGAGTRMVFQPGMTSSPPTQIFLHDAMHHIRVLPLEPEGDSERDVGAMMQNGVVVPKLHVVGVNGSSLVLLGQQFRGLEDFGNEHRPLPFRRGRKEVQILPNGAADGAGNTYIVFEARPSTTHGFGDELCHDGTALDPEAAVAMKLEMLGGVANYQAAKALV